MLSFLVTSVLRFVLLPYYRLSDIVIFCTHSPIYFDVFRYSAAATISDWKAFRIVSFKFLLFLLLLVSQCFFRLHQNAFLKYTYFNRLLTVRVPVIIQLAKIC